MKFRQALRILTGFGVFSLWGCDPSFKGEYVDPVSVEILDEYWNESDARKTAEVLIRSCLSKPWLEGFMIKNQGKPIVVVKDVENRTDEHIDTRAMLEAMRDELINSGKVRFIDGKGRQKILDEINYQQNSGMVSGHTQKKKGRQLGADFMLTGAISSQVHGREEIQTTTYQTVMQLTDLETSEIIWSQRHNIKKKFKRSGRRL